MHNAPTPPHVPQPRTPPQQQPANAHHSRENTALTVMRVWASSDSAAVQAARARARGELSEAAATGGATGADTGPVTGTVRSRWSPTGMGGVPMPAPPTSSAGLDTPGWEGAGTAVPWAGADEGAEEEAADTDKCWVGGWGGGGGRGGEKKEIALVFFLCWGRCVQE